MIWTEKVKFLPSHFQKTFNFFTLIFPWKYEIIGTFFCLFLLSYNSHNLQFTHLKCTIQWGFYCIFTSPILEHFYNFEKEPSTLNYCTLIFLSLPIPQPYATTSLLLVSVDLTVLNMSYEWNCIYVLCVFLCVWDWLSLIKLFSRFNLLGPGWYSWIEC